MMKSNESFAWASQDIREAIKNGSISAEKLIEDKIQPASYDPSIGNEIYILDADHHGIFRISPDQTVYENLLQLPRRQRKKIDISNGFELKKGFSYLIPLEEEITLKKGQHFRSSPKSSMGRLFINTRLISDYNPSFNEGHYNFTKGRKAKLWLFVQPLAFNIIVWPGSTFNQLRFFDNYSSKVSPLELTELVKKHPLLYVPDANGVLQPADSIISDGITIHLNLSGTTTEGIVGFRALHNPTSIDLKKKGYYEIEEFFEPIHKKGEVYLETGEYYLLSSKEVLKIPKDISCELRDYSQIGFSGPLHYAGFIDNGFNGDLVYEVRSDEISKAIQVAHNMPVSKLDIYRSNIPDKIYGEANNNYQFQIGPKPSKFFLRPDYKYIARNYSLLDYDVLSIDKNILDTFRTKEVGFEKASTQTYNRISNIMTKGLLRSRYLCEDDDLALQLVSYVILINENQEILVYKKVDNLDIYAEQRLFNKYSAAIGSHFTQANGNVYQMLQNELAKKGIEVKIEEPQFIGTVFSKATTVDRSHFGLVYTTRILGEVEMDNDFAKEYKWIPISTITKQWIDSKDFEEWSKLILMQIGDFV